jgi:integrase
VPEPTISGAWPENWASASLARPALTNAGFIRTPDARLSLSTRGAILGLRWDWVDLNAGVISLPPSQNRGNPTKKKPRIVPIYGEMRACLEMAQAEKDRDCPDCKWVVQYGGARVHDIKTAFHAACERVGIKGSVLIHDLRHTALTNMEEAGVPRHIAMTISGHKTESAYRRYLIGRERSVIEAGRTMEQWMLDRETGQRSAKKPS